jgi:hypothetical protein
VAKYPSEETAPDPAARRYNRQPDRHAPGDIMSDDASPDTDLNADVSPGRTPPATFEFLVHTLFTQALMAFGRIPNPITNKALKNVATAKHFIDTLAMLEAKTQGNLSTEERNLLEEMQHQLRMLYLEETKREGAK